MNKEDPVSSSTTTSFTTSGGCGSAPPPPQTHQKPCQPQRRRLEPSEKQLKQQQSASCQTQRQKSFSNSSQQTIMAGLYDLEETLGKGHFATVKAAKHVFTGERVAVKVIDKTKLDSVSQKALLKEVLCMKLVQHPNVVKLYEVIDTSSKMYLVLELGQGDLYDLILRQQGGLPEPEARVYFTQILTAVSYCHKLHVAHRDLKPENVVFFPPSSPTHHHSHSHHHRHHQKSIPAPNPSSSTSKLGQVKLTDFGFSNKFCPGVNLDTSCGSLAYSAPEILLGDSYSGPSVDIWSLGVILYMLACGRAPFQEANDSETLTMIMDVKYSIPDNLSSDLKDLIRRMLVRDPGRRATLQEIETHAWVVEGEEARELGEEWVGTGYSLPLISSNTLSDHEKDRIFGEMVKGGVVASVEEVKSSLRTNAYNHVTSTFYLLAERFLREKTRRTVRTPTSENHPSTPTSPTAPSHPPTPTSTSGTTSDSLAPTTGTTPSSSPPSSPPMIRIRKNSHQFEDVVLPSTLTQESVQKEPKQQKQPSNIAGLDLDTTNQQRKKFVCLPVIGDDNDELSESSSQTYTRSSRNSSPHHPHYYHHLGRGGRSSPSTSTTQIAAATTTTTTDSSSENRSSSPPKYCNSRARMNKSHHSHSDSSDEGSGGQQQQNQPSSSAVSHPTISIVLSEEERQQEQQQQQQSGDNSPSSSTNSQTYQHHLHVNNNVLKPSPSYEGIVDDDEDGSTHRKRGKKKRVLFLSWFFKRAGGGKVSGGGDKSGKSSGSSSTSSSSRNIYKTKSCSELKTRSCNAVELDLNTRECFGVCNGSANTTSLRKN